LRTTFGFRYLQTFLRQCHKDHCIEPWKAGDSLAEAEDDPASCRSATWVSPPRRRVLELKGWRKFEQNRDEPPPANTIRHLRLHPTTPLTPSRPTHPRTNRGWHTTLHCARHPVGTAAASESVPFSDPGSPRSTPWKSSSSSSSENLTGSSKQTHGGERRAASVGEDSKAPLLKIDVPAAVPMVLGLRAATNSSHPDHAPWVSVTLLHRTSIGKHVGPNGKPSIPQPQSST
jgi:hypothetical protein